jgi:hypothetical protein
VGARQHHAECRADDDRIGLLETRGESSFEDPVVHLCRAKGRFGIKKSYSWSEADQPFRVALGLGVSF